MRYFILSLFFSALVLSGPVFASQPVVFKSLASSELDPSLQQFLSQISINLEQDGQIGIVDLNGDYTDEYIVSQEDCLGKDTLCTFKVLAWMQKEFIQIGEIQAKGLFLGNRYENGVRHIMAFDNALSDYDVSVYRWDPKSLRYIKTTDAQ